jgi:replicative DNA helicase
MFPLIMALDFNAVKEDKDVLYGDNKHLSTEEAEGKLYRIMPQNLEAEQALLGALLVDNSSIEKVGDILEPEHFYAPQHQRIYAAIRTLIERGQSVDPVTLKNYFETDKGLEEVGGAEYLSELAASVISVINAGDYANALHDLYLRRSLIHVGEDIVNDAYDLNIDRNAEDCLQTAESSLFGLAENGNSQGGFQSMRDAVQTAIEIAEKAFNTSGQVTGVTTGMTDLDKKLGGFQPSDLIILAGRPSMGKTALATNMAARAAQKYAETGGQEGGVIGFFSLEMSADQLATRILADLAEISGDRIRRGDVTKDEFRIFAEASARLAQFPLFIDDTPALSIGAVRTRVRRLKRQHGLNMIVVDYLQLLRGTGSKQSENRVNEISEITRGLKAIAKEFDIPVIALSQLSRAVESRDDKRPQLSDLRESGSIEQDADVVMFVYREEYYVERQKPDESDLEKFEAWQRKMDSCHQVAECIVAKQRHGPIGPVRLHFEGRFTRFSDLDPYHSAHFDSGPQE